MPLDDALRDRDRDGLLIFHASLTGTGLALASDDASFTTACGTGLHVDELPEDRPRDMAHLASTLAGLARGIPLLLVLDAASGADRAGCVLLHLDLLLNAVGDLFQGQFYPHAEI